MGKVRRGESKGQRQLNSSKSFSVNIARAFCLHHILQLDNYLLCYLSVEPDFCIKDKASVTGGSTESEDEGRKGRDGDGDEDTDRGRNGVRWEKQTEPK